MANKRRWTPPNLDQLQKEAERIFKTDLSQKIRHLCQEISTAAIEKKLFESVTTLHGELLNGLKTPHHQTIYEHILHLSFFESQIPPKKLNLLDLCCGNGEFTFIANARGHHCVSIDALPADLQATTNFSSLNNKTQCLSARRALTQKILKLDCLEVKVSWDQPLPFSKCQFDVIYINQSTIHYPGSGTSDYWKNHQWSVFLENLLSLLAPDGMIFITLADPTYLSLSNYLLQFYVEYSDLFYKLHTTHWWPLLIINKNRLGDVKNLRRFSQKLESFYFRDIGRSNRDLIRSRSTPYS